MHREELFMVEKVREFGCVASEIESSQGRGIYFLTGQAGGTVFQWAVVGSFGSIHDLQALQGMFGSDF